MGAPKGRPRPDGSGIKKGQKAQKTIEREMVVQAWVKFIDKHTQDICNKLLENNPAALASFLGRIAPKDDKLSVTNNMPVIVRLPVVEGINEPSESDRTEPRTPDDTTVK